MPLPAGMTKKAKTATKTVMGAQPTLFLDKLGERLAFERSGTRLYEALVSKHDAFGSFAGGPSKGDLEAILQEEYRHFTMLASTIKQLGGDPTVVTPSADLRHGVARDRAGDRGSADDPAAIAGGHSDCRTGR